MKKSFKPTTFSHALGEIERRRKIIEDELKKIGSDHSQYQRAMLMLADLEVKRMEIYERLDEFASAPYGEEAFDLANKVIFKAMHGREMTDEDDLEIAFPVEG